MNLPTFPQDADGEVLRRLQNDDFDFTKNHDIDFNIDFSVWPPTKQALLALSTKFDSVEVIEPSDGDDGYVNCVINARLTYDFVMQVQIETSRLMGGHGGRCDSWGVLHE